MTMAMAETMLVAGKSFPAMTSQFPVPFTVVRVNPVRPEFTIHEQWGDGQITRVVKLSVFAYAVSVVSKRENAARPASGWSICLG